MTRGRCWAFGIMGRCELEGGHEDAHEIVTRWGDEDTVTFDGGPAVVQAPVYRPGVPDVAHSDEVVTIPVRSANCFTCGCDAEAHLHENEAGEPMCRPHQCRQFVPDF